MAVKADQNTIINHKETKTRSDDRFPTDVMAAVAFFCSFAMLCKVGIDLRDLSHPNQFWSRLFGICLICISILFLLMALVLLFAQIYFLYKYFQKRWFSNNKSQMNNSVVKWNVKLSHLYKKFASSIDPRNEKEEIIV
ncbi:unnamed protein product [Adineta ricciae]|uniref:Uncharacterized protein n=1 Tax=Adineta ricciae TaxID=249248 RepID=A0A815N4H3_ADIRI|nr:unnamed protein product [Adineta ricciae]CAF1429966.1 unnamed protein product [Adineta ricciae]